MSAPLTPKQAQFIEEFLLDFNGTQAAAELRWLIAFLHRTFGLGE
jgi:hypothetical protein